MNTTTQTTLKQFKFSHYTTEAEERRCCATHGHLKDTLYPTSVYRCQNEYCSNLGGIFHTYASGGAVCWCCPRCSNAGEYIGWTCIRCAELIPKSHLQAS